MKIQISFEILVSLCLAFALMLYILVALSGLAPKLDSLQQSVSSYVANSATLSQSMMAGASCFQSSVVLK